MPIFIQLLPTVVLLGLGYILKKKNVFNADFGRTLLKFVFYLPVPALSLRAISTQHLDLSLSVFFLLPVALSLTSFVLVKRMEKRVNLPSKQFAVFLLGTMMVNSAFSLPFIQSVAGDAGVARVSLYNIINSFMIFGLAYSIAISYGKNGEQSTKTVIKKVVFSPALIAVIVAICMNLLQIKIPAFFMPTINALANLVSPLILIALGLILELKILNPIHTFLSLAIRMIGGLFVGFVIVKIFNLTGLNQFAVLLISASPIGFNVVTFSSMEKLDDGFAASLVSAGLVVGFFLLMALTLVFGHKLI